MTFYHVFMTAFLYSVITIKVSFFVQTCTSIFTSAFLLLVFCIFEILTLNMQEKFKVVDLLRVGEVF